MPWFTGQSGCGCCGASEGSCPTQCINAATLTLSSYTLADTTSGVLDDIANFGTLTVPMYNAGVHGVGANLYPWLLELDGDRSAGDCITGSAFVDNAAAGTSSAPGNLLDGKYASTTDCSGDVIPQACDEPPKAYQWRVGIHPTDGVYLAFRGFPVHDVNADGNYWPLHYPTCTPSQGVYVTVEYTYLIPYTGSVGYSQLLAGSSLSFSSIGGEYAVGTRSQYSCSADTYYYPIYDLSGSIVLGETYPSSPDIFCDWFGNEGEYWTINGLNGTNSNCGELYGTATSSGGLYSIVLYKDSSRSTGSEVCGVTSPTSGLLTLNQLNSSGVTATVDFFPSGPFPDDFNFRILS